jgi:putative OPT family oligopeptide transporter
MGLKSEVGTTSGAGGRMAPGEFTWLSVGLGLAIALVMTAANVYLGLYAGMTVSASIPSAVLGMAAYRMLGRREILGANIVQTLASSGESLAAGAIFTIPALVLVGAWQDFRFWPTTLIAMTGGLLGIAFMVPLRRLLIVESPQLTYPEGVACAEVLRTGAGGAKGGVAWLIKGFVLGGAFKLMSAGLGLLNGSLEWAARVSGRIVFAGSDLSPALLSVGFITGLGVAFQVFMGGAIAWIIGLPLLHPGDALAAAPPLDAAWGLWSGRIRYLGVGAMVAGGLWSIFSIRKGIFQGMGSLMVSYRREAGEKPARTETDMPGRVLLGLLAVCAILTGGLYYSLLKSPGLTLLTTVLMLIAAFVLTGVSSYIVGLVGSSNNPVSGMTISALLGTAAFFLLLGFKGDNAVLATLGVAAVVCCAACSAADCSQDLKTGYLVGSTPKAQQYAEVIGAVVPAFVIGPVLSLLHHSYRIGVGLKAPQATLFASLAGGLFGKGTLPVGMIGLGLAIGIILIAADALLEKRGSAFRLHPMPVAVGMYLPFTLSVPILLGGLVRYAGQRALARESGAGAAANEISNAGVLLSSGLIAGESILGVALAACVYFKVPMAVAWHPGWLAWASLALFLALAAYLARAARRILR